MTKLTIGERMAKLEQKVEDVCSDVKDIKLDLRTFINSADNKYATKYEISSLKKMVYTIGGGLLGFLLWGLQQFLTQ